MNGGELTREEVRKAERNGQRRGVKLQVQNLNAPLAASASEPPCSIGSAGSATPNRNPARIANGNPSRTVLRRSRARISSASRDARGNMPSRTLPACTQIHVRQAPVELREAQPPATRIVCAAAFSFHCRTTAFRAKSFPVQYYIVRRHSRQSHSHITVALRLSKCICYRKPSKPPLFGCEKMSARKRTLSHPQPPAL